MRWLIKPAALAEGLPAPELSDRPWEVVEALAALVGGWTLLPGLAVFALSLALVATRARAGVSPAAALATELAAAALGAVLGAVATIALIPPGEGRSTLFDLDPLASLSVLPLAVALAVPPRRATAAPLLVGAVIGAALRLPQGSIAPELVYYCAG